MEEDTGTRKARILSSLSEATKAAKGLETEFEELSTSLKAAKEVRSEFSRILVRLASESSLWGCETGDPAERQASFDAFIEERKQFLNIEDLENLKSIMLQGCMISKKCKAANKEKSTLDAENKRLHQEVDNCKKEVTDMVVAAETKLETLMKKNSALRAKLGEAYDQGDKNSRQGISSQEYVADCENMRVNAKKKADEFKSKIDNLEKDILEVRQKKTKLQAEKSDLQEQLDNEISFFNSTMASLSETIIKLQQLSLEKTKKMILEMLSESMQPNTELKGYKEEYEDLRASLLKKTNILETKLERMDVTPPLKTQRLQDLFQKLESVMCSSLGTTHMEIVGCLKELLEVKTQEVALSKEVQVLEAEQAALQMLLLLKTGN